MPPDLRPEKIEEASDDETVMGSYRRMRALPAPADGKVVASDAESIRRSRPRVVSPKLTIPSEDIVRDKILGGWQGRAAGCILGKPPRSA